MFVDRLFISNIAMITLLAGCALVPAAQPQVTAATATPPARTPQAAIAPRDDRRRTAQATLSDAGRAAADLALADLAQQLGVSQAQIEVLGVQPEYGAAGKSDRAATSNGWRIRLAVAQDVYHYQVDARGVLKRLAGRR
jgi:hypothetical protein